MSVADRVDVRAHGVEQQMHGELGRKFALTGELAAFQIGHHQIPRFKHPLIHAGGGGEDAALVEADGDVPFTSDDEATVVHPFASRADFTAVLLFGLPMAGAEQVGVHSAQSFPARNLIRAGSLPPRRPATQTTRRETRRALYHTKRRFRATLERWPRGQSRACT